MLNQNPKITPTETTKTPPGDIILQGGNKPKVEETEVSEAVTENFRISTKFQSFLRFLAIVYFLLLI